jgi:hypothetical protein
MQPSISAAWDSAGIGRSRAPGWNSRELSSGRAPVVIVNRGATRGDRFATTTLYAGTS